MPASSEKITSKLYSSLLGVQSHFETKDIESIVNRRNLLSEHYCSSLIYVDFVRVNIHPGIGIYKYHVTFQPFIDFKLMKFQLLNENSKFFGPARVYDGDVLFLPYRIHSVIVRLILN